MAYLHQQLSLNIEYPIIQAPMAGVQDSQLAIAVANAGGLGSLPCAMYNAEKARQEIEIIQAATTRTFNVNFFCHQTAAADREKEIAWIQTLSPFYAEFGIDLSEIKIAPARAPFNDELADVLEEMRPGVVSFHFGLPDEDLLARVKSWDSRILSSATNLEEGLWLAEKGVDAVIAQGIEAGGHRGIFLSDDLSTQVSTFDLLPELVKAIDLPIIAAGGIASSLEVKKAFELGASAVQVGTSFLRCSEATTSAVHRQALANDAINNTVITNLFTGRPARAIRNRLIDELGALKEELPEFPNAANALAPLRRLTQRQGVGDFSSMWSGTNVSGCRDVSAAEIMQELTTGIPN